MKKNLLIKLMFVVFAFFAVNNIQAQCDDNSPSHTDHKKSTEQKVGDAYETSFKVFGHCEECQKKIQIAALSVNGVKSANWDIDTKQLKLSYAKGTDIHEVHKAIVAAGYSTESLKAEKKKGAKKDDECKSKKTSQKKEKSESCDG